MIWKIITIIAVWYLARDVLRKFLAAHRRPASACDGKSVLDDYATLGCRQGDSDDKVRAAYRAAARKYHPDRLRLNGVSEDKIAAATAKMAKVNAAWDRIKKSRGL